MISDFFPWKYAETPDGLVEIHDESDRYETEVGRWARGRRREEGGTMTADERIERLQQQNTLLTNALWGMINCQDYGPEPGTVGFTAVTKARAALALAKEES